MADEKRRPREDRPGRNPRDARSGGSRPRGGEAARTDGRPVRGAGSAAGRERGRSGEGEEGQSGHRPRNARAGGVRRPEESARARPNQGRGAPRAHGTARDGEGRPEEPELPEDLDARELPQAARRELGSLSKNNAELVARHLAMAARVITSDPARASAHAQAAVRRAGRVAVARETAGIAAYAAGDFALALRELRTYRRISGRDDQIALIVDSERGVGRPERALAEGASVTSESLPMSVRAELAIAMSGARLDLGEPDRALRELDRVPYPADQVFAWSADLAAARATVLEDLGRAEEAARWRSRAEEADAAWDRHTNPPELEVVVVEEETVAPPENGPHGSVPTSDSDDSSASDAAEPAP